MIARMARKMPLLLAGLLLAIGVLGLLLTVPQKHAFGPLGPGTLRQSQPAVARVASAGAGLTADVAPGVGGPGIGAGMREVPTPQVTASATPTPADSQVSAAGRALVPSLEAATATEDATPAAATATATPTMTPTPTATATPTPTQTVVVPQRPSYVAPTIRPRTPTVTGQPRPERDGAGVIEGAAEEYQRDANAEP